MNVLALYGTIFWDEGSISTGDKFSSSFDEIVSIRDRLGTDADRQSRKVRPIF